MLKPQSPVSIQKVTATLLQVWCHPKTPSATWGAFNVFSRGMGRNVSLSLSLLPHASMHKPETSPPPPCFPQLMICNAVATVLYITAFVTCAAAVQPTSWRQWDYNRRAAASVSTGGRGRARGPGQPPCSHLACAPLPVLRLCHHDHLRGEHLLQLPRLERAG